MLRLVLVGFLVLTCLPVTGNPMKQVAQVNSIPMFMPYLVKKADVLKLTPEQVESFAKWRAENMAPALAAANTIKEGEYAIKQATLNGGSKREIQQILTNVANAREDLSARTLRCHDYTRAILNQVQWQQLLDMYKANMNT